jgi:hypothetical protein
VILVFGLYAAFKISVNSIAWRAVLLTVLGQLILHLVYGPETFIYAIHWFPLLVIIAGAGLNTRLRVPLLACILLLTLHNFIANLAMHHAVMQVFRSL